MCPPFLSATNLPKNPAAAGIFALMGALTLLKAEKLFQ